jgi:kynureninase
VTGPVADREGRAAARACAAANDPARFITVDRVAHSAADREHAAELDGRDPLAGFRDRFARAERDGRELVYLDGNSLGRLPLATAERISRVVRDEWGTGLIGSWDHWIGLPARVGDLLGEHLLGAAPGQVAVSDSTTVNLYKLACAALDARPGRRVIVTDDDNFPTDRYVTAGIAAQRGCELRMIHTDMDSGLDEATLRAAVGEDTALVTLSHVAYRSAALADMAAVTELVHASGAVMLWDLSHSAGSVPVQLDACDADLAVGCTYKYLNAGPGAPAFLYVRRDLQDRLRQPVWGWFGQRDLLAMGPEYDPVPGIGRFTTGTPQVAGIAAVEEGARLLAEAGIDRLRDKGVRLTEYLITLADKWLAPLGCSLASPRDPARRGSHVTLHHRQAQRIYQALAARGVITDYRSPDRIRYGLAPMTTRFTDVWDAMAETRRILEDGGMG